MAIVRPATRRVGRLARLIAEQLGLPREEIECVELAGLLHDVGKVAIPDAILQKQGPLDQEERAIMMGHTEMGAHILQEAGSDVLEPLVPLVLHHHEWWDGRGYPHSLRGNGIPVGAQIRTAPAKSEVMASPETISVHLVSVTFCMPSPWMSNVQDCPPEALATVPSTSNLTVQMSPRATVTCDESIFVIVTV